MASNLNTDVPESIAGYYYQTLLAIRELSNISNDEDAEGNKIFILRGRRDYYRRKH